jgi:uncharacterized membrane protein YbhN (UPF0104 family)
MSGKLLSGAVVLAVEQFVPGAGHRLSQASSQWLAGALALDLAGCASYVLLFHTVFDRPPNRVSVRRSAQIGLGELAAFAIVLAAIGLGRTARMRPGVWHERLRSGLLILPDGVRDFALCIPLRWAWIGSLGWWIGDCGALWAALHACGGAPALNIVVLAYMLGQLGNALPLPGGVGGVEPLMLGIFVASGVNAGLAAAAIICYRAIALGVQGIAGTVALATLAPELRATPPGR